MGLREDYEGMAERAETYRVYIVDLTNAATCHLEEFPIHIDQCTKKPAAMGRCMLYRAGAEDAYLVTLTPAQSYDHKASKTIYGPKLEVQVEKLQAQRIYGYRSDLYLKMQAVHLKAAQSNLKKEQARIAKERKRVAK